MKLVNVMLLVAFIFLSACSTVRVVQSPTVQTKEFIVGTEQQQQKGEVIQQNYAHPFEMDLADLKNLLSTLTYVKTGVLVKDKEKEHPVFQPVEIDRLAPALVDALSKADASQRVRFLSYNSEDILIFSNSRETEGIIFITPDNRFNIAFSFINTRQASDDAGPSLPGFTKIDPLAEKESDNHIIAAPPFTELHTFEDGDVAPMWLIADLNKIKEAPRAADEKDRPVEQPAASEDAGKALLEDIKTKLEYLKELLDQGMITEEDYNTKKQELLDKIK
jgi:hypothetical protein